MKKSILYLAAAFLSIAFTPVETKASNNTVQTVVQTTTSTNVLPEQTKTENPAGQAETKVITKKTSSRELHVGPGGIYISVGALLIIIIILIIIF
ncbi:MAG TPA: hypothetical protein VL651_09590 [Bacteroidia bacterium]|jgi:hypothetical protein|nr:hypothetical protein [Bacteroidia bacterium]